MITVAALVVLGAVQSAQCPKADSLDRALEREDAIHTLPVAWSAPRTTVTIDEDAIVIEAMPDAPRDEWSARAMGRVRSAFWARTVRVVEAM